MFKTAACPALTVLATALLLAACSSTTGPAPKPAPPASANAGNVWSPRMEARQRALEAATANSGIAVLRSKNNELQANVPSDFSFDTDSATLKPSMKHVLDDFAVDLELPAFVKMRIRVVGHTDSRGSDAVNDPLSLARALAVAKYLQTKGVDPARVAIEGRGEREPMIGNDMPITRALNRRVEMFLSEPAD